ncbi:MAG: NADH-quinone oxidoreductase subunit J [Opitutaceae bacterium]|jgi:NADH-quinone oxidoreductase subunit J|nr:NADH-quinone oxidoreductase subunit J [Opitutaceae bacterium]
MPANFLFYALSTVTLAAALGVVLNKNAVASALSFFVCLCGVAALFVMLDAYLPAFLLILVYAGAVVALFLFIIMLLDMGGGDRKPLKKTTAAAALITAALLAAGVVSVLSRGKFSTEPPVPIPAGSLFTDLKLYGAKLFTTYMLPVQLVGFLLLIAMLGVIVLSKKQGEDKKP